jgi:hypothetical protein
MECKPFLGWRPSSITHYNKVIAGGNSFICKGLRVKKLGRFNKYSINQFSKEPYRFSHSPTDLIR